MTVPIQSYLSYLLTQNNLKNKHFELTTSDTVQNGMHLFVNNLESPEFLRL